MSIDAAGIAAQVHSAVQSVSGELTNMVLMRTDASSGDSFDPTPGGYTDHACTVVFSSWKSGDIDGESILSDDQMLIMSPDGCEVAPEIGDKIWDGTTMVDGKRKTATLVPPLKVVGPSGTPVMYKMNVRY